MTLDMSFALPAVREFAGRTHTAFLHGAEVSGGEDWIETVDPSTAEVITHVAESGLKGVDAAVASAHEAFTGAWASLLPHRREKLLHALADLIESHATELAQYDALESGKPVAQVETVDVALAVEQFRYYAGWPTKLQGATVPVASPDAHVYTRREPLGVVAAITPWNFPLCQAAIKLAPALAAGCTAVLKPSELTSLSSLRLAELAVEAGLPEGVLNVVTGTGAVTGSGLVAHPLVRKISFTGSGPVGRVLAARAGQDLKHISLELGGKNPHIIFADADVEKAAAYAATTAFFYTGQVCFAGSRILVQRQALDAVMSTLESHAQTLVLGRGLDPASTMGPLSSKMQLAKVQGFIDSVSSSSGEIALGGGRPGGELAAGYFLEPTVVVGPADEDPVTAEEIFGPVVVVQVFDEIDEVITRANAGDLGLTAGVWTDDVRKAHSVAAALQAGTVWVNTYADFNAAGPWGGYGGSGLGRDCGPEGLDKYLQTKTVWMSLA